MQRRHKRISICTIEVITDENAQIRNHKPQHSTGLKNTLQFTQEAHSFIRSMQMFKNMRCIDN